MAAPLSDNHISIAVVYREQWPDDFAARGWKLSAAVNDPMVIASTPYTGGHIATSVFVHDILDHYLCGLPLSGHRNEAIALTQLGSRTHADISRDYRQMIEEDILHGQVNGEPLDSFLPGHLRRLLPYTNITDKEKILYLADRLGMTQLRQELLARFFELGQQGIPGCRKHWQSLGLDYLRRAEYGSALQILHQQADEYVQAQQYEHADCRLSLDNNRCSIKFLQQNKPASKEIHVSI